MSQLKKIIHRLLWLSAFTFGACSLGLSAIYLYLSPNLPSVESIKEVKLQSPLRIYSFDDKLIGEFGEKRRLPIKLNQVPQHFINALLAAEDAQFYSHNGVSIRGLLRAVSQIVITGKKGSGGSTLTMQLTRHIFLTLDQTFSRKFNEILLALRIEQELSKDEILELYVNYMFLGKRAYGINSAADVYYGKPINQLSLAQLAMIAGLFQGPSTQNPIVNPTRAVERRNWILKRMLTLNMIDQDSYMSATQAAVTAQYHESKYDAYAPYVAELAREKAIRTFGLDAYTKGYKVYTTIDSESQIAAQNAIVDGLIAYDLRHGYRGAEQRFPAPDNITPITTNDTDNDNDNDNDNEKTLSDSQLEYWQEKLKAIPDYAGLTAAIIIESEDTMATAINRHGDLITLPFEQSLSWARPYISENSRGPSPKLATDVVNIGDLVRLKNSDGLWVLSQIPDAQAALVSLNPKNGSIVSLVGGFDFNYSHFNRATQAQRQPGSNFKPFIYTAAIESGMTAATVIIDAPIVSDDPALEGSWRPSNDSGKFYGPTRLRTALTYSRNVVSVKVLESIGINKAIRTASKFGFDRNKLPKDLTLVLGSASVTPIDIAAGYAVFANGGYQIKPHLISKIIDIDGNVAYQSYPHTACAECEDMTPEDNNSSQQNEETPLDPAFSPDPFALPLAIKSELNILQDSDYPKAKKVIDDQVVFIMDSILKDVVRIGTGKKAMALGRNDLAGKTGTTNGPTDTWFSGYNDKLVTSVWVGFDRNAPLGRYEFGGSAALPIWMDYMKVALKDAPETPRRQPPGIVSMRINAATGKKARINDQNVIFEYFRAENAPQATEESNENIKSIDDSLTDEIF